ncbi:PEP-CTERM sorting domain-containing protein [Aeoliella mucimassa]|uniref:PEP-CTERM protein-sorting domain-containing protein n=1 Tax=Aeoliella mucimassa TaxID=2527972 RepID=A0A518AIW5_9BACT|nr:PEP-CTERM sorting domain-containing protein [Aeoliella mucimassa]QDU54646.1 hypothetical protein Pan181_08290 [Aeoliella mucimassa]
MSIAPSGSLRLVFEDDEWGSTLHFAPGIQVRLNGTLELLLDDEADVSSLVGTSFQVFDWTGVTPNGEFDYLKLHPNTTWDTSQLYNTGYVTLTSAVPEPSAWLLALLAIGLTLVRRSGR